MNQIKIALIIFCGLLAFSACEKDDICVDADTPRLIIRFYDATDTTEFKNVQNLIVRGLLSSGAQDPIPNIALDSIVLPLRVDASSTSFTVARQLGNDTDMNIDTLTFAYEIKEIFISRGCGYIVNYDALKATVTQDDNVWIQDIRIDSTLVKQTISAHVKIFH